jgi:hypothetical protein
LGYVPKTNSCNQGSDATAEYDAGFSSSWEGDAIVLCRNYRMKHWENGGAHQKTSGTEDYSQRRMLQARFTTADAPIYRRDWQSLRSRFERPKRTSMAEALAACS